MARAAGTAQDNATISPDQKRPKGKNAPRFRLPTPENQRPIGATPIGTGVPDPGVAPERPSVPLERNETPGSADRRKAGFPNYTTTQTQAGAALPGTRWHRTVKVPGPLTRAKGAVPGRPLPLAELNPPSLPFPAPSQPSRLHLAFRGPRDRTHLRQRKTPRAPTAVFPRRRVPLQRLQEHEKARAR